MWEERSIAGKVCMVTGGNRGIGKEIALGLAQRDAKVVLVCRNHIRGESAQEEIKAKTRNPYIYLMLCDLSSLASVRTLSGQFGNRFKRLDILVNNAGGMFQHRQQSVDGYEMTMAVNHLSHYLLTSLLIEHLRVAQDARVINVSSDAHRRGSIDFNDMMCQIRYRPFKAYADSKLAQVLFTQELSRRLGPHENIDAFACHPGFVASGFARNNGWLYRAALTLSRPLQKTPKEGAQTPLFLATSSQLEGETGQYFASCAKTTAAKEAYNEAIARQLWDESTRLTGMTPA